MNLLYKEFQSETFSPRARVAQQSWTWNNFSIPKKKGRKIKNREETLPLFDTIRAFFCVAMIIRLVAMNWMDIIDIESGKQRNEERERAKEIAKAFSTQQTQKTHTNWPVALVWYWHSDSGVRGHGIACYIYIYDRSHTSFFWVLYGFRFGF